VRCEAVAANECCTVLTGSRRGTVAEIPGETCACRSSGHNPFPEVAVNVMFSLGLQFADVLQLAARTRENDVHVRRRRQDRAMTLQLVPAGRFTGICKVAAPPRAVEMLRVTVNEPELW